MDSQGMEFSSYQAVDYMPLLSESLAFLDCKTLEGEKQHEEKVSSRCIQLSVTEKMRCFNRLVFERSILPEDMCFECLSDLIKVSYFSDMKYQSFARSYEDSIINLESPKENDHLGTFNEKLAISLIEEVKGLQSEHAALLEAEREHDSHMQLLESQERLCDKQLSETRKSLNVLQYQKDTVDAQLQDQYVSSITAEQEIHLLSSPHFSPLFHLDFLAVPSSLSSSAALAYRHIPFLNKDCDTVVLSINGFRVSYLPLSATPEMADLNWTEINAGWSAMCTAFAACLQLVDATCTTASSMSNQALYSYEVVCLRHSAVLVETTRRRLETDDPRRPGSSSQTNSYCLSCSTDVDTIGARGSFDEYIRAMLALAIIVIEVAVTNCRLDIMTSFSKLSSLHAHAKSECREVVDCHGVGWSVDVLAWPSLDQLLLLKEMKATESLRDLANDVLLALACLLAGPSFRTV